MAFDPDAYLASAVKPKQGFDPDAYLGEFNPDEYLGAEPSIFDRPPPKFGEFQYPLKKPEIAAPDATRVKIKRPAGGPTEPAAMAIEGRKTVRPMLAPTEGLEGEGKGIRRTRKALEFGKEAAAMGLAFELAAPLGGLSVLSKYPMLASTIRNVTAGIGYGGAKEAVEGGGVKEVAKKAAIEGATWAALGPVFEALGGKAKAIFNEWRGGKRMADWQKQYLENALKEAPPAEMAGGIERAAPTAPITPSTFERKPAPLLLGPGGARQFTKQAVQPPGLATAARKLTVLKQQLSEEGIKPSYRKILERQKADTEEILRRGQLGFQMTSTPRPRTVYDPQVGMEVEITGKPFKRPTGRPVRIQALTEEQQLQRAFEKPMPPKPEAPNAPLRQKIRNPDGTVEEMVRPVTKNDLKAFFGSQDKGAANIRTAAREGNKLAETLKTETINLAEVKKTAEALGPLADIVLPTEAARREALTPVYQLANEFELLGKKIGEAKEAGASKEVIQGIQERMNYLWAARKRLASTPATQMVAEKNIEKGFVGEARRVSTENEILNEILKSEKGQLQNIDEILSGWNAIDKSDPRAVAQFYRRYLSPKGIMGALVQSYRYNNVLSGIRTHAKNFYSNVQNLFLRPAIKATMGVNNWVFAGLKGEERKYFIGEGFHYLKGLGNFPDAIKQAFKAYGGHYQVSQVRDPRGSALVRDIFSDVGGQKFGPLGKAAGRVVGEVATAPSNALEMMDAFAYTLANGGERAALNYRNAMREAAGKARLDPLLVNELAKEGAMKTIFRGSLFEPGQGKLWDRYDKAVNALYETRKKHPSFGLFAMFLEMPMNAIKQGTRTSPAGILSQFGKGRATGEVAAEHLAQAQLGSLVTAAAGFIVFTHETRWTLPRSKGEKALHLAAGESPFSIRIGDYWVPVNELGVLSFPIGLAMAVKHAYKDQEPDTNMMKRLMKTAVFSGAGMAKYIASVPAMQAIQGMGDLWDAITQGEGAGEAGKKVVYNLGKQFIPGQAFFKSLASVKDRMFRDPEGFSERVMADMPLLSEKVDPLMLEGSLKGVPVPKSEPGMLPYLNVISPSRITKATQYQGLVKAQEALTPAKKKLTKIYDVEADIEKLQRPPRVGGF